MCPLLFSPPAISTRPSASRVAVWPRRSTSMVVLTAGAAASSTEKRMIRGGRNCPPLTIAAARAKNLWLMVLASEWKTEDSQQQQRDQVEMQCELSGQKTNGRSVSGGSGPCRQLLVEDRNTYLGRRCRLGNETDEHQSKCLGTYCVFLQNAGMRMIPHGGPNSFARDKNNSASAVSCGRGHCNHWTKRRVSYGYVCKYNQVHEFNEEERR